LRKKQRIRKFIFKTFDLSLNQYVLKGLATVFSLGSLGRVSDILTFEGAKLAKKKNKKHPQMALVKYF